MRGRAYVEGKLAAEAELSCVVVDRESGGVSFDVGGAVEEG
jgi:hypothetical protein